MTTMTTWGNAQAMLLSLLSLLVVGCSQQMQDVYKIEIDRACRGCDLQGINLSGESLGSKYRLPLRNGPLAVGPEGLNYVGPVDLTGANLQNANFSWANLRQVIFNQANLTAANLAQTNLEEAQFVEANLSQADLQGADLRGANLQGANLRGANLSGANLQDANLTGADLADITVDVETQLPGQLQGILQGRQSAATLR